MSPNCAELITATLAAQLAGIAAPINGGLSREHIAELLRRSGARVLVTAGPELAPDVWDTARELAARRRVDAILVLRPTGAPRHRADPLPAIDGVRVGYLADSPRRKDAGDVRRRAAAAQRPGRVFPHRRHHRRAEAGRAHPRQRGQPTPGCWPRTRCSTRTPRVFAALPLFHVNALVVTLLAPLYKGQHGRVGRPAGLPRTRAVRPVLEDRRALPDRRDERGPDRLRRARAGARSTQTSAACGSRWSARRRCRPRCATASRRTPGCPCSRATA